MSLTKGCRKCSLWRLAVLCLGIVTVASAKPIRPRGMPVAELGCAEVGNSQWVRRLCFGQAHLTGRRIRDGQHASDSATVRPEILEVSLNLTVTKRGAQAAAAAWEPACGDTLHVQFRSTRALFGALPTEMGCGVHQVTFYLPRDSDAYSAHARVVHIDGEGRAEPPFPRLFPKNLATETDGPRVFNMRAIFPGVLHTPAGYATAPGETGDAYDWQSATDAVPMENFIGKPERDWGQPSLPVCKGGETPGRWVHHQKLYPDVMGEPLEWRPFGCYYRRYNGEIMHKCFTKLERVKFIGESTLGQMYEHLQMYMNASGNVWPLYLPMGDTRTLWAHPAIRGQHEHGEFHGMTVVEKHAMEEVLQWKPRVVVMLQGANDAARDTVAMFETRLRPFLAQLKEAVEKKEVPLEKFVWINAPTRHYKAMAGPGTVECPEGNRSECSFNHGELHEFQSETEWGSSGYHIETFVFWGTLDRRRKINLLAREIVPEYFPDAVFLDYQGLTEGLPVDYSLDGEHYGCPYMSWQNRHRSPFHCRSLGNIMLANLLVNILCNEHFPGADPSLSAS